LDQFDKEQDQVRPQSTESNGVLPNHSNQYETQSMNHSDPKLTQAMNSNNNRVPTENINQNRPQPFYSNQYKSPPNYSNQYKAPPANNNQYNQYQNNQYQNQYQDNQYGMPPVNPNQYGMPQNNQDQNYQYQNNQYQNNQNNQNNQYGVPPVNPNQYGMPQNNQNQNYQYQNNQYQNNPNNQYGRPSVNPNQYGMSQNNQNQNYQYQNNQYQNNQYQNNQYGMPPDYVQQYGFTAKSIVNRVGLALFILSIVVLATQFIAEIAVAIFLPGIIETDWYAWALTALSMVGTGLPVYYLVMKRIPDSPKREIVKLKPLRFIKLFFICVSAMYLTNIISSILTVFIAMLKGDTSLINPAAEAIMDGNFIITVIYAAVVAPIVEELIFRKLLLDKLRRFGDLPAILFTGLAFGLFHMNLSQFFYAAVLGFIFAYITIQTNTVRYSIILHMMINLMGTAISPLATEENLIGSLLISAWILVSIAIGIVFFVISIKKIRFEKAAPVLKKSQFFLNTGTILYTAICFVMIVIITLS
jgi:uncharacterized protein